VSLNGYVAIVCGSHVGQPTGVDWGWSHRALDAFDRERRLALIIQGGATGIDTLVHSWAQRKRRPSLTYWADWDQHKRAAGPVRNVGMLALQARLAEAAWRIVCAFPGREGTENMVSLARESRVPVWRCVLVGRVGFDWVEVAQ
jgi:hypothetical protein